MEFGIPLGLVLHDAALDPLYNEGEAITDYKVEKFHTGSCPMPGVTGDFINECERAA
jgi:hypothetical protein